ncbi:helix-turn-helix domain-containing protein [Psychroserpens burtonensis]|uniref:helix-turn-helix domain-containing protein n=1 Tax=Psychroserpens burtonensis TaxID=49278 RepID=UPI0003FE25E6|nr:helix-turn-helix domain-containing protein [Psychroserpens burtonensis]
MELYKDIKKPTKKEQIAAMASYNALAATLEGLHSENPEIEIEETSEKIKIPLKALKLLAQILKATSQGKPISVVPIATEMTTQAAAELLGCSRPHFVKLLEQGDIPFTKVGKHRRVKFEDVINYKKAMKLKQEQLLKDMMKSDEELGLYNT